MSNKIIYTNLAAKPKRPTLAPTAEAPAAAPAPPAKRIHIGWGEEGRKGVAARSAALAKPVRIRTTALSEERREHRPQRSSMESRPDQLPNKQQLADADEIAQRVKDTSRSATIEHLLNRQMNRQPKLFEGDRQPQPRLEHLAIARRSDGYFQLVSPRSGQPFSRHRFETARYCAEAAAELENTFDLEGMLDFVEPELLTHIEVIVLATVWRERVERQCAIA